MLHRGVAALVMGLLVAVGVRAEDKTYPPLPVAVSSFGAAGAAPLGDALGR